MAEAGESAWQRAIAARGNSKMSDESLLHSQPRSTGISGTIRTLEGVRTALTMRVLVDAVAIFLALASALVLRFFFRLLEVEESSPLTLRAHLIACVIWAGGLLSTMALNRLYEEDTLFPGGGEVARVFRSIIEAGAVFSTFVFLTQSFYVSRSWFGLVIVLSTFFLILGRSLERRYLARLRSRGVGRRPVILVSDAGQSWAKSATEVDEFEVVATLAPSALADFLSGDISSGEGDRSVIQTAALILRPTDFKDDDLWTLVIKAGQRGRSVFVHSSMRSVGRDRLTFREMGGDAIVK
jgi:hypothetical protein